MSGLTVVKVGGSLYDLPDLGDRLRRFLATLAGPVLLIPGGGPTADVVRQLDEVHRLGEEAAHWLALRACEFNAYLLAQLLPGVPIVEEPRDGVAILDLHAFAANDESRSDHLPHQWDVTSDSLALRAAQVFRARELVLLKSVAWAGSDWSLAAQEGIVDPFFPRVIERAMINARVVSLRS